MNPGVRRGTPLKAIEAGTSSVGTRGTGISSIVGIAASSEVKNLSAGMLSILLSWL